MCIKDLVSFIWFGGLIFDLIHILLLAQLPQTIDLTSKSGQKWTEAIIWLLLPRFKSKFLKHLVRTKYYWFLFDIMAKQSWLSILPIHKRWEWWFQCTATSHHRCQTSNLGTENLQPQTSFQRLMLRSKHLTKNID